MDVALDATPLVARMKAVASLFDRLGRVLLVLAAIIGVLVVPALAVGLVGSLQVGTDPSTASLLCWGQDCRAQGLANLVGSIVVVASAAVIILVRWSGSESPSAGVIAGIILAGASLGLLLVSRPHVDLAPAGVVAATFGLALAVGSGLRVIVPTDPCGERHAVRHRATGQADR